MKRLILMLVAIMLAIVLLLAITTFASPLLRGPLASYLSNKLDRPVTLQSLSLNLLTLSPSAKLGGLHIPNPQWAPANQPLADIENLAVSVKLLPLLGGHVIIPSLTLNNGSINIIRDETGRANWQGEGEKSTAPLNLPDIRHFALTNGQLNVRDDLRKLRFTGRFTTEENAAMKDRPFTLNGEGELNGQPFNLGLTGGALLGAKPGQPYPFTLTLRHGTTTIGADGALAAPLDFTSLQAELTATGQNLADLYPLTGLSFPLTRPYKLSGVIKRNGQRIDITSLSGTIGGSDIAGALSVETGGERPRLTADLASKLLDPADAGVLFGEPDTTRLLPDKPFAVERFRSMDATVRYRAAAINVNTLPLKQVELDATLEDGLLTLNPLGITLPQGRVTGTLSINAQRTPAVMSVDAKLTGARLQDFMSKVSATDIISGSLGARVQLSGAGTSVHQAAARSNGTVTVVIPNGEVRQAFAELMGVNARGVGLLLAGDTSPTPIRCAIGHFQANNGIMHAHNTVFATDVVTARGKGTINLKDETLDLTFKGEPTELRLVRVMAPVKVTGTLRKPAIGVDAAQATTQAAVATALGFALTPLASILPFIDPGAADNPNCKALITEARSDGVPVSPTSPTSP